MSFKLEDLSYQRQAIERVKRVIEGYDDDPQPMPEAGFKVYKLQKSNFPRCEFRLDPEASKADNVASLKRYIEDKEAAHFISLERGLTTTAKWNLKHFLGNHFNAF